MNCLNVLCVCLKLVDVGVVMVTLPSRYFALECVCPADIPPSLSAARWGRGSWPFGMWRWAPGVLASDSIKQTTQQGKLVWKLIRTNKTWLEGNENNFLSCLDHWNAAVPRNPGDAVRMLGSGNIADKYTLAFGDISQDAVVPVSTMWSLVACSERVFKTPNEMHCINYLGGRKLRWYLMPIKCFYLEWPILCVIGWNMVSALKSSSVERSPGTAKPGALWNRYLHPCSFIQTQEHPFLTSPSSVFIRMR